MNKILRAKRMEHVHSDIRGPLFVEAMNMQAKGIDVLKLNTGNPATFGFKQPKSIEDALEHHTADGVGYCDFRGMPQSREAISSYHRSKGIKGVTADDVFIGNGVSEVVSFALMPLLNDGDEVLVPTPSYSIWGNSVYLAGGKPVFYVCDEKANWYPDIDDIRSKITSRTKAIVVINPNNPTGMLYPREILEQIVEVAREAGIMVFADEIYDRLVMDGLEHTSIAALADDVPMVTLNGLSKSHCLCGYRCGWMCLCGDKSKAKGYIEGINLLSSMRLCSNVPAQSLIPTALDNLEDTREMVAPGGRIYEQREYIYNAIQDIPGLSAYKPKAAFYIFPKLDIKKFNITNDEQFSLDLLKEKKILITHGGGFHWETPDHFRIVYLPCIDDLKISMDAMKDFLATYKQK